jgi:hypothetical protein
MDADHITVVSGLPRSGTSMLMKMLEAGGLEPVVDGIRRADADNPGGYYEFEKVKKMGEDVSWLETAQGKVIKVISQLLEDLPTQYRYKVLFAHREMAEILASQQVMLERRGQATDAVSDDEIDAIFQRHLDEMQTWLATQDHLETLHVQYGGILADSQGESKRIADFLGVPIDQQAMAEVVDANLYRQRKYRQERAK